MSYDDGKKILCCESIGQILYCCSVTCVQLCAQLNSADLDRYPFMAALYNVQKKRVTCGGSVIAPTHVITAAHCVENLQAIKVSKNSIRG